MEEEQSNTNRRTEERLETEGTARVRILDGPFPELKNASFDADLIDVSQSGLCLDCDELLDQCTLLMRVQLHGASDDVPIRGEVRWASWEEGGRYQMGVEFTGNDSPVIIKWHNLLREINA